MPRTAGVVASINGGKRWPNARIPYVISSLYSQRYLI
jgi:hypothetical protein